MGTRLVLLLQATLMLAVFCCGFSPPRRPPDTGGLGAAAIYERRRPMSTVAFPRGSNGRVVCSASSSKQVGEGGASGSQTIGCSGASCRGGSQRAMARRQYHGLTPRRGASSLVLALGLGLTVGGWPHGSKAAAVGVSSPPTVSASFAQVVQGYRVLVSTLDEWSVLRARGGDEVRRKLGTVGTSSPLFRLGKALDTIREDVLANEGQYEGVDVLALVEASAAVLDGIKNGDFLAYSSNFSSYGNGGGGVDYLEESRKAIETTVDRYKELLDILHISAT